MPLNEVFVVRARRIIEVRPFYWDTASVVQALKRDATATTTMHDSLAVVIG